MATFKSNRELWLRWGGAVRAVLIALLLPLGLLGAGSVAASEVVDLRVGSHPEFTRVVFELDTPTGYRIERASPEPGVSELVVSIDASSIPRKIQSTKSLIGLVRITPNGDRAVARIRLNHAGLRLKEMILANPPRIVLDVLAPVVAAKKAPAPAVVKAPKPVPPKPKVLPKEAPPVRRAAPELAPPVAPEPEKPKARSVTMAKPKAKPVVPAAEPSEGGIPSMGMEPKRAAASSPSASPEGAEKVAEQPARRVEQKPTPAPAKRPPLARQPSKTLAKKLPRAPSEQSASSGVGTVGVVLAAVGVLVLVVFLAQRRRRSAADEPEADGFAGSDDNPFSSLLSTADSAADGASGEMGFGGVEQEVDAVEVKEAEPVDEPVRRGGSMELDGAQTVVTGVGAAPVIGSVDVASGLGGSEEVSRMVQEFERRIASLETRLDEVVDARERLERQVSAQTEELRVQRAAIARTQRAVRNLSRPDEDGPTEPALRDPS